MNKPIKVFANFKNRPLPEKIIRVITCYTIFSRKHKKANEDKIISHLDKNELIFMTEISFMKMTEEKKNEVLSYCKENKIPVFFFSQKSVKEKSSKKMAPTFFLIKRQSFLLSLDHMTY